MRYNYSMIIYFFTILNFIRQLLMFPDNYNWVATTTKFT